MDDIDNTIAPFEGSKPAAFEGPYNIIVKHDSLINAYVMHVGEGNADWWDISTPEASDRIKISLTQMPRQIEGPFSDSMSKARNIALVQLTGERLLERLLNKDIIFAEKLEKLWVFMPTTDADAKDPLLPMPEKSMNKKMLTAWKKYLKGLSTDYPNADIKLKLYDAPAYFGGSFFDWQRKGGRIHLSPYVWGVPATNCPGYDMAWLGDDPSPVYNSYVKGLEKLMEISVDA